jgi:bifunctional DNA-binding transcriptional regulator/antitoxin component of YhaV-PrlF toxin-antitoxin module
VPKWARDQYGLRPGQPLELIPAGDELRLRPQHAHAAVVRAPDGSLVFGGELPQGLDGADEVDKVRSERARSLWE